jgi:transcription elongation factor Elf1
MKIKKIISQYRRDFVAIFECEHCGYFEKSSGYDDENYHADIIPKMICSMCGKIADESYRPLATKYKDNQII